MASLTKPLHSESRTESAFLDTLLADYPKKDFQVRLPDGAVWGMKSDPRFAVVLKEPGALREMFSHPSELKLGEDFIFDEFDIEGDIEAAFELADYLLVQDLSFKEKVRLNHQLHLLPKGHHRSGLSLHAQGFWGSRHTKERDRRAISFHYDLPSDFFALWLDSRMVYSSAYFHSEGENLEAAQRRKLDYICRKLRLQPGERFLDIGCGWGGLVLYAAAEYGVESLGVTLSAHQAEVAKKRIREAGVGDRCRVKLEDYRDLDGERFDKIASVGMFEHVGEERLPAYYQRAWDLLKPAGVMLNHGISHSAIYHRRGPSFIDHYVFPDGDIVPISTSLRAAESSGFEIRDVESLREHYALTLHHWVKRLENHAQEARNLTNDATYRTWRLYMAGSAHGFRSGRLNLYQVLLGKPVHGKSGLPLTRMDWYSG